MRALGETLASLAALVRHRRLYASPSWRPSIARLAEDATPRLAEDGTPRVTEGF